MMLKILSRLNKIALHKNIGIVMLANMIMAGAAFLKDVFIASYMGTSSQADALLLAFFIPDAINNSLAVAIGVACIPVLSHIFMSSDKNRFRQCITNISIYFTIVLSAIMLLLHLFRGSAIGLIGAGLSTDMETLSIKLFTIMLPIILFWALLAISSSALQVLDEFTIPAFAPALGNVIILISAVYLYVSSTHLNIGVYVIASAISISSFLMFVMTLYKLEVGSSLRKSVSRGRGLRHTARVFNTTKKAVCRNPRPLDTLNLIKDGNSVIMSVLPYLMVLFFAQCVLFFERYLASRFIDGGVAALNYAYRLSQFPIWIFVAAIGTVIFPHMSKSHSVKNIEQIKSTLFKWLGIALMIAVPMAVVLFLFRTPIISILFQRGEFNQRSVMMTSDILIGYSIAIVGQCITAICIKAYMALKKMSIPVISTVIATAINIAIDFCLIHNVGLAGLGYGAAIGAAVNALIMIIGIRWGGVIPI